MGVKKLTTFMENNYLWEEVDMRGERLVIDGYALCYELYFSNHGSDWHLGGDYCQFYTTVQEYFYSLRRSGIDPHIVMDGIDYEQTKVSTMHQRHIDVNKRISKMSTSQKVADVLPLLAHIVFSDAMRDMNLKFYVADGEADVEIASLANHLKCPVLSRDSDFYIFNLEGGYIPMSGGNCNRLKKGRRVKVFTYRKFDKQFSFMDPDIRLLLPVILGNDFHRQALTVVILDIDPKTPADEVVQFLTGYRSVDKVVKDLISAVGRNGEFLIKRIDQVRQFYRIPPSSIYKLRVSKRLLDINPMIPEWVLDAYKKGDFLISLMSFIVPALVKKWEYSNVIEDMYQMSAWEFTRTARLYMFGTLLGPEAYNAQIVEVTRPPPTTETGIQHTLINTEIVLEHKHRCMVHLSAIPSIPVDERRVILLRVFHCKGIMKSLSRKVSKEFVLAVIASHFWLKNEPSYYKYVQALVRCILKCYGRLGRARLGSQLSLGEEQLRIIAHAFAQWQCTLHHVIAFNQVLDQPYQYTSPAHTFSGRTLHYYLQCPDSVEESEMEPNVVKDMTDLIVKGIPNRTSI